jgi:hypothetical protein
MERTKILIQLIDTCRDWSSGKSYDASQTGELRRKLILENHAYYTEYIPLYRKLAGEEGCGKDSDIESIMRKMMLSVDVFKSYRQSWLDENDYDSMNRWLSGIFHRTIEVDVQGVNTIEGWIDRLGTAGVHVVYSSGTSGTFSFVPRDKDDWKLAAELNTSYLTPLLASRISGNPFKEKFVKSAFRILPAGTFSRLSGNKRLTDFDAVFLGFRGGRMGNQALITELAPLFRSVSYLYDIEITGNALRCLTRGARNEEELRTVQALQEETVGRHEENYRRITDRIRTSTEAGQKVFIFGAPYQFKELCEFIAGSNRKPVLKKGSFILFGGGWKSFIGETVDRESLVNLLSASLNIPSQMVLEGYSMTEINALTLRCEHGRFHIPPVIEPVIFDEELNPVKGNDIRGVYGFLDPMAVSYPGFLITGDYVRMVEGTCECGLSGPAVMEIGRVAGSEIKGCGGIMSSMQA